MSVGSSPIIAAQLRRVTYCSEDRAAIPEVKGGKEVPVTSIFAHFGPRLRNRAEIWVERTVQSQRMSTDNERLKLKARTGMVHS